MQGLPPPRQTGSFDALSKQPGTVPPLNGPLEYDDDDESPADTVSSVVDVQDIGPTPNGEISPQPPLPASPSLSDIKTEPSAIPAGPEQRTLRPAPTLGIADAVASPSSPTVSGGQRPLTVPKTAPSQRRGTILIVAALAISVGLTALIIKWPQPRLLRHNLPIAPAPSVVSSAQQHRPMISPDQEHALAVEKTLSAAQVKPDANPEATKSPTQDSPSGSIKPVEATTARSLSGSADQGGLADSGHTSDLHPPDQASKPRTTGKLPRPGWISGVGVTTEISDQVVAAMARARVPLFPGEQIVISMRPNDPNLTDVPARLTPDDLHRIRTALRGFLFGIPLKTTAGGDSRITIVIKCPR
jgi:hypothetical protein